MGERIPVWGRGGVVAHALVDEADYERLSRYRWHLTNGYVMASAPGTKTKLRMHRVVLGLTRGDGLEGDHRNGDKLDNRRSNLRVATRAQNGQNLAARRGTSRFRGVSYQSDQRRSRPWRVVVMRDGRCIHVGSFATEGEAAIAAAAWYAENFPFAEASRHAA